MTIDVDKLRLLYLANLHQPVSVSDLRSLHLEAKGNPGMFRQALQDLREEKMLALDDPTYCTGVGLAYIRSVGLSKRRDISRMFLLKDMFRKGKL